MDGMGTKFGLPFTAATVFTVKRPLTEAPRNCNVIHSSFD